MYKYKVSIVMAVYNVELFLREAIESIIEQDIGFENIQLILVDDGSPDGSGAICDEYAEKYPQNIVVIHKENGGVSSARNAGLACVEGKYVNVLDSDDKLSGDTVRLVYDFFEEHKANVDLVAIPLIFFDAKTGSHPLNIKFEKGTRVINLQKEWDLPQLSLSSTFVKAESIKNLRFDAHLAFAEDAQLVVKILSKKQKMGVVAEAKYLYRKRSTGEASAIQTSGKTWAWFLPCVEHFSEHTIHYCKENLGHVPRFIQFIVMYDLQFKFRQGRIPAGVLTDAEKAEYRSRMYALLSEIDDCVILGQRSLDIEQKIHLLYAKHPGMNYELVYNNFDGSNLLSLNGIALWSMHHFQLKIYFINIRPGQIEISGEYAVPTSQFGIPRLFARANGEEYPAVLNDFDHTILCMDEPIWEYKGFIVSVPLKDNTDIDFVLKYNDLEIKQCNITLGKYCPITNKLEKSYYYANGHMLYPLETGFRVVKGSKRNAAKAEMLLLKELMCRKDKPARNAVLARVLVHLIRPFAHKNIWLIMDKADRADDNGEAFFLYCMQHKKEMGCYPIFAISKHSPDYQRLKKCGPVVPYMSWRHKLLHLLAKHTVSAYSHDEITSPFLKYSFYYCDMLRSNKIIFLQHGIIKDDLSKGLNRNRKDFSLFVTSTKAEYESVVVGNYGYSEKQVILTGLPRYDRLYHNDQKKITIMPTWRRDLFGTYNSTTSVWSLRPGFEGSAFYHFYSDLVNSKELLACAEKLGYKIQFLIHPTLFPYLDHFEIDPAVNVLHSDAVYRDVFAESSLILTDYSSVAFDMAYLRKPVVYAHFDSNHYAEGYFDYERDGFGEVEYTLEGTIRRLIEYMENGCQLKDQYRERIDHFFMFNDRNNSQRICEKIMELDHGEKEI